MDNIKYAGRKRIKDRGIKWEPRYRERSEKLKKRFDKQLGHMAYIRWEGHDYTTDSDYFIIMGPSLTKEGKKRFFAGIKKLPDDPKAKIYAPSGEYFTNSISALSHIVEKWGVQFPRGAPKYTTEQLEPLKIPRHVKGENMKVIKKSYKLTEPLQQMNSLEYLRSYVTNLRSMVNTFAGNLNNYKNTQQVLMNLEEIQTALQQIIASVQDGSKKTVVTPSQDTQQARIPLVELE